ncbi:isocitrate lyase/PEP mutase family protein [Planococcus glaciei]|uniref:isocitrate lyase/PEP mutase family protein n=1 Tax=Planococcus glaciei TaxID=459472 RepID=UPI001C734C03|nr:oxaloacetate decarboxylase [Planococcus glaciei]MBX0314646.1 oxaloacetate decarboxylase [Planococcus glaciei]
MDKKIRLRELINAPESFMVPGAYDAMSALLIEELGFQAIYATGAGISNAQLGWADVGLTSMKEAVDIVARITDVTSIPVIADIDTGFGNAINVIRTVREFERAGIAGLQIEDQVSPKKCGHFNNKSVISKEEMVNKIHAIVDARQDENLVIIARTDALAVNGVEDAIDRAKAYKAAGADVLFVEAPTSLEQMKAITDSLEGIPQLLNLVEGAKTPIISLKEAEKLGYQIVLCANTALRASIQGVKQALSILKTDESQENLNDAICSWEDRQKLFKLNQINEWEEKYLSIEPKEEVKNV